MSIQTLHLTGAALPVSRGITALQAAPAGEGSCSCLGPFDHRAQAEVLSARKSDTPR